MGKLCGFWRSGSLLIEISTGNTLAKRRLRLELAKLAGEESSAAVAGEIRNGWRRSPAPASSSTGRTDGPWSMICKFNAAPSSTRWPNAIRPRDWN